jgi:hypothetical protein
MQAVASRGKGVVGVFALKAALVAFSSVVCSSVWAASVCSGAAVTAQSATVTYSAYVVTDVSLAGHFHHNAQVTLTFQGNAKDIHAFYAQDPDQSDRGVSSWYGQGQCIDIGQASVKIVTPGQTMAANFLPGQILVAYDVHNFGIGFSSYTGPRGIEPAYPLSFVDGTVALGRNTALNTTFNLSGKAWSCIGYPPLSDQNPNPDRCGDPNQYPLHTDQGDFVIYQPYNNIELDGTLCCNYGGTLNRGTFSAVTGN